MARPLIILALAALGALGCEEGLLTRDEARAALNEASLSTQIHGLVTVVASSGREVGAGTREETAQALHTWWSTEVLCGTAGVEGTTVTVLFDEGGCPWLDRTWTGQLSLEVTSSSGTERSMSVLFTDVGTGLLVVSGTMESQWDLAQDQGTISHSLVWSDGNNGRVGEGETSLTFAEDGAVAEIEGLRTWDGDTGAWSLTLDKAHIRGADPVPETGTYTVESPLTESLVLAFERASDRELEVAISGPGHTYHFTVVTP